MIKRDFSGVREGEAIYGFFIKVGRFCKRFCIWAWESKRMAEYFAGSLIMFILGCCGLFGLFGLGVIFWATFAKSWLWFFSWIPAIALTIIFEMRVAREILSTYEEFFK